MRQERPGQKGLAPGTPEPRRPAPTPDHLPAPAGVAAPPPPRGSGFRPCDQGNSCPGQSGGGIPPLTRGHSAGPPHPHFATPFPGSLLGSLQIPWTQVWGCRGEGQESSCVWFLWVVGEAGEPCLPVPGPGQPLLLLDLGGDGWSGSGYQGRPIWLHVVSLTRLVAPWGFGL